MQSFSNYITLIPQNWSLESKSLARSDIFQEKNHEITGQFKDFIPTNYKFSENCKKNKEKIKNNQEINRIPSNRKEKNREYKYSKTPDFSKTKKTKTKGMNVDFEHSICGNGENLNKRISCQGFAIKSPKSMNSVINKDDFLKVNNGIFKVIKGMNLPSIEEFARKEIVTSQTPSPGKLNTSYKKKIRNFNLSLKPEEFIRELYYEGNKIDVSYKCTSSFLKRISKIASPESTKYLADKKSIFKSNSLSKRIQNLKSKSATRTITPSSIRKVYF